MYKFYKLRILRFLLFEKERNFVYAPFSGAISFHRIFTCLQCLRCPHGRDMHLCWLSRRDTLLRSLPTLTANEERISVPPVGFACRFAWQTAAAIYNTEDGVKPERGRERRVLNFLLGSRLLCPPSFLHKSEVVTQLLSNLEPGPEKKSKKQYLHARKIEYFLQCKAHIKS